MSTQSGLIPDWEAIGTVVENLGAIATFLAVYVAIEPTKLKLSMNFYMLYNSFTNLSLSKSNPKLLITNTCNRTVVIHSIAIMHKNNDHLLINLISDNIDRPFISKVNDKDFDKPQPIVLSPGQTTTIEFNVVGGLSYLFGHYCDEPNSKDGSGKMYIIVTESFGKKVKYNTGITYKQYYDNLVAIQNDFYN